MHWNEIISFQSALSAVIWDLFFIGGLAWLWRWAWKWWSRKPDQFRRRGILSLTAIVCSLLMVFLLAKILVTLSGHIAEDLGKSLRPHPQLTVKPPIAIMVGDSDPKTHIVIIDLRIYNAGAPTVLWNWQLQITGPKQTPFMATLPIEQIKDGAVVAPNGQTNYFYGKDSIVMKTLCEPIQTGGMKDGHVLFVVPETSRTLLDYPETAYELTFLDIEDNPVT